MITLAIDASTYRGTVALLDGTRVVTQSEAAMRGRDAERLMPAVSATLSDARCDVRNVDRLVCGAGPGSFTSLRIAASIAKGIAVGREIPLFGVSSLALIVAANATDGPRPPTRYLAVLDALRGECFVELLEHHAGVVTPLASMRRVDRTMVSDEAERLQARAVGPDEAENWAPHARGVALLEAAIAGSGPVNVAGWEPSYGRLAEAQAKWESTHGRALPG